MSEKESTHGLACPNCGGVVPILEGQVIVQCPYCDLRSVVRGERGLQRYQIPRRIDRQKAIGAMQAFLGGHRAIAGDTLKLARLNEAFVAYLPFWASWAHVLGWVFGQKRVRQGESTTYKPREVKVVQDMNWNSAACDVGEFGVESVTLAGQPLEAFNPDVLHTSGLVFEPVGSVSEARTAARQDFTNRTEKAAGLNRIAQVFVRFIRERFGLVYYPLWVLRYLYRGRSFQVVVDGYSGRVLYGKAPGNTLYRAAMLVGGMALGAFLAIDGSAISFYIASQTEGDSVSAFIVGGFALLAAGFGVIGAAYRTFRYGEQFEYRSGKKSSALGFSNVKEIISQVEDVTSWIDRSS